MKQKTNSSLLTKRSTKSVFKAGLCVLLCLLMLAGGAIAVFAASDNEAVQSVNRLRDLMFTIVQAIGVIILLWGIVQVGMSIKSHDPSQRAQGFLVVAGGLVIVFAKSIIQLIAPSVFA